MINDFGSTIRHSNFRRALWIGIAVAAFVSAATVALLWRWLDEHAGIAAWVQAIGSILVIAATAIIAGRSAREAQRRDRLTRQQLRVAVGQLARSSINALDTYIKDMKEGPSGDPRGTFLRAYAPDDFEVPLDGLSQVPLHQIDDAILIELILRLRGVMGRVKKYLETVQADPLMIPNIDIALNYRTPVFNAVAGIIRTVDVNPEPELSRLAARY